MSRHLHLRAFTGRSAGIAAHLSAHAINPAIQPLLSCLPALSLADIYRLGDDYAYGEAFKRHAVGLFGAQMADRLIADLYTFQDGGWDAIEPARSATLRALYQALDSPAAREVVEWLDGKTLMNADDVKTQ